MSTAPPLHLTDLKTIPGMDYATPMTAGVTVFIAVQPMSKIWALQLIIISLYGYIKTLWP
jgi:hypothetical protein